MLWDEGWWEPIGNPHEGLSKGKLEFKLHGKRLTGTWTLVRMRDRPKDKGRHNWLLIKRTDASARAGDADHLLAENDTSVATGRTMEGIAGNEEAAPAEKKKSPSPAKKPKKPRKPPSNSMLPAFSPPQLATLADAVPKGKQWVHEIKFDGYRALAYIEDESVRIFTRTGQDWTHKFRSLANTDRQARKRHSPRDTHA